MFDARKAFARRPQSFYNLPTITGHRRGAANKISEISYREMIWTTAAPLAAILFGLKPSDGQIPCDVDECRDDERGTRRPKYQPRNEP